MTERLGALQFSLKTIFGLTTLIGFWLWLVLLGRGAEFPVVEYYAAVGLAQFGCVPMVYRRLRTLGAARVRPNEQPYELALLGAVFTLDTWALMVAWIACCWAGIDRFWPLGLVLSLTLVCVVLHLPTLCLQAMGLWVMPDWWRDLPLTALFFLNISNSLLVLIIVALGARELAPYGLVAPG
jgi:hypothetical protein